MRIRFSLIPHLSYNLHLASLWLTSLLVPHTLRYSLDLTLKTSMWVASGPSGILQVRINHYE